MLSQYDRQQLEMISNRLHMEDPEFASSLRHGRPRPLPVTRRWPLVVIAVLSALVLLSGFLVMSFGLIFAGGLAIGGTAIAFRRGTRRAPKVRTRQRGFQKRRWS
jgi:hypothetical protein